MIRLPDTKNVFEIIYRYRTEATGTRDFYLEGKEVNKFMQQLGSASIMSITHGATFEPLNWKVRNEKRT